MKLWGVLQADLRIMLRRMPLIIVGILLCVAAFLLALPTGLFSAGEQLKISLAVVCGQEDEMADAMIAAISDLDIVDKVYTVDMGQAREMLQDSKIQVAIEFPENMLYTFARGERSSVQVEANDALFGPLCADIARQTLDTMNRMQRISLAYREISPRYFADEGALWRSQNDFNLSLLYEALSRDFNIKLIRPVIPFHLQSVALVMFITVSVVAVFISVTTTRQVSSGYARRIAAHRIRFLHVWMVKALMAVGVSVLLCLVAALLGIFVWDLPLHAGRVAVSSALLALILCAVCMAFVSMKARLAGTGARTLLGCVAALLFLLFAGGGFYPIHLMDIRLTLFNPAWLTHILSEWSLGAGFSGSWNLLCFGALLILCLGISAVKWREAFC